MGSVPVAFLVGLDSEPWGLSICLIGKANDQREGRGTVPMAIGKKSKKGAMIKNEKKYTIINTIIIFF